ncbi:MAG: hypothetical protein U1F43_02210 [Myxococcota bacterium]
MAIALNLPTDLLRARWWSRHVANKPLADLLDDLEPTEPEAAGAAARLRPPSTWAQADRGVALAFLETHALAEWVKRWRPRPEVVKDDHIGELRRALHAVAELFEAPPEAVPSGLTLLAPIDLGILAHRLRAQPAEHPALAADMPYWVGNMTVARWLTTLDRREQRIRKGPCRSRAAAGGRRRSRRGRARGAPGRMAGGPDDPGHGPPAGPARAPGGERAGVGAGALGHAARGVGSPRRSAPTSSRSARWRASSTPVARPGSEVGPRRQRRAAAAATRRAA